MTGQVARTILGALAAEARARPRWGEKPALYFVYLSRGLARLERAAIPGQAWGQRPEEDLHVLAEAAAGAGARRRPGLHAVAFRGEARYAEVEHGTVQSGLVIRGATAGTVSHRPGTRIVRAVMGVDRAGNSYEVTVFQDTGETRGEVHSRTDPAHAASGQVLDDLELMICAYLGVTLPERAVVPPSEAELP